MEYCGMLLILSVYVFKSFVFSEVVIAPLSPKVRENDPVTLTCTLNKEETVTYFTWSLTQAENSSGVPIGVLNQTCISVLLPVNSSLYEYSCPTGRQSTWTIKKVTRQNEGDKIGCQVSTSSGNFNSEKSTLTVEVQVSSVNMIRPNDPVTEHENTEVIFECKTSGGLPAANVTWYKDLGTHEDFSDDMQITAKVTNSSNDVDGLKEVKSILKYSLPRNENGSRIYCAASNIDGQTPVLSSKKPQLNVLYPPAGSPVIEGYSDGDVYRVIENTEGRLECSITGGNPAPALAWNCANNGLLETISDGDGTNTKVQTWMAKRGMDTRCTCQSSHYSGDRSVSINIEVLYPPTAPTFKIHSTSVSGKIKVIRNNQLSVSCNSSGKPSPSYKWTYPSMATLPGSMLSVSNVQNNGTYTCNVRNSMNSSVGTVVYGSNSSSIGVLMLYPPSIPTFKYWNTSGQNISKRELDVIQYDTFKVACTSSGEPAPSYYWDNQGNNRILTINSISTDRTSLCEARNTMQETVGQKITRSATASLKINVLYSPSVVTLKYHDGDSSAVNITTTLSIREGNPFTVTCSSVSKPPPSYAWTGTVSSTSATLKVDSAVRSHMGTFACNVENNMTRTFANPDKTKVGRTSRSFTLQVLFPPVIGELKNTSVVEGSPVTVSCPVTVGYPRQTSYEWIRNGEVWKRTQKFTIDTTSRNDATFYKCNVSNTMEQTGEQPVSQPDTKSFYLNVWYRASVIEFSIIGHKGVASVVMDENDTVPFKCNVDSNPGSDISVYYQGNVLKSQNDTKSLAYSIESATCTDKGNYSCVGFNQYNKNHPSKHLSLFVNCSPRPSPSITLKQNVTSAQYKPAVLTFTTLAYPEPNDDDFKWYRLESKGWQLLSNSGEFQIETSNLQTNLTIKEVNRTYYGTYRLDITNKIGNYSQPFYLEPEDIPDQPKEFRQASELVTESSITLQWKPGFDNGPDQTFILRYKKVSDDDWTSVSIPDTGEEVMNYTITMLSSGTEYEVVLQATNKLGNSSKTETLKIKTIAKDIPPPTNLGLILGVVCGVVAILVLSFLGFLLARKLRNGKAKKKSEVELNRRHMDDQNEDSSDDEVVTENAMYESASNVGQKKLVDDNVYAKPQKKSVVNTDVYAVVNKTKKQDKKKKQKSQQKKADKGDIYENAPDTAVDKDKTYANSAYEENPYETPDQASAKRPKKNADGLIYADLAFNEQPKGQKKLVIHGLDSMTEYVEVDFTKKADPLPDSDTEDQK